MPLYEFCCEECQTKFEQVVPKYDETGQYPGVVCPECGSEKKQKLISACSFMFNQPEGTDRWRNSHDYRYKHTLPKAQSERKAAEAAAKVKKPYNPIDDINSGKHFGEVK